MTRALLTLLALLLLVSGPSLAAPSSPRQPPPRKPGFVDRDGDGINDGQEHRFRKRGRRGRGKDGDQRYRRQERKGGAGDGGRSSQNAGQRSP